MSALDLPFQPIRQSLYKPEDLFQDFNPADASSWGLTSDFKIYQRFVEEGRDRPPDPYIGMMQALHDSCITQCTEALITKRKVAAIMGGHDMTRGSLAY